MEQDNRRKLIGNSFSPIHCAVYVFPYKVVFTLLDTETEAEADKIWLVWNSVGGIHAAQRLRQNCHWVLYPFHQYWSRSRCWEV